jgi:catechol 2,3-dioxygenase-like lactoylglutathione lyase family enzyme
VTAGLDHIGVVVSDLDRALEFWHGLIGLPVTARGEASWPHLSELNGLPAVVLHWCTLSLGGAVLELTSYRGGPPAAARAGGEDEPGRAHVGVVVDDLDEMTARLRRAGVTLRSDAPVRLAAGAYRGWRALYAVDPDGTSVELFEAAAGGNGHA